MKTNPDRRGNQAHMVRMVAAALSAAVALSIGGNLLIGQPVRSVPARPPAQPVPPGTVAAGDEDNPMQVYIPDSFAAQDKLNRAMAFERKEQIHEAIEAYQGVIDDFGDKLTKQDNSTYVSIQDIVRQRLQVMPAVKAGGYDDQFGVPAEAAIKKAVATKDITALIKACDRYYIATAAVKGMQTAAEWEFERGEFAMASRIWSELADHPRAGAAVPEYLHHAALAAHLDGTEDVAKELRDKLHSTFAGATGDINGKTVNLVDNLDELMLLKPWTTGASNVAPGEWPTFGGNPARSAVPDVSSTAGAKLWSFPINRMVPTINTGGIAYAINQNGQRVRVSPDAANTTLLSSYAVMSQDMLYVHAGDRIVAMNASSGGERWVYPANATQQNAQQMQAQQQLNMQRYGVQAMSSSIDTCTVYGDEVFAILPASSNPVSNRYGGISFPTKLVGLDRNGQELFSVNASDPKVMGKVADQNASLTFVGSPVATQHGVFVLLRRTGNDTFTNLYLCRINRQTGALDWCCYLCGEASTNQYGMLNQFQNAAVPAYADDTLYVNTGQGVDAAIDAPTGRVRWLTITEAARQPRGTSAYDQQQMLMTPQAWKINAPIVVGDKLVTLEPGTAFRVFDRWTGKPTVQIPTKDLSGPEILAGVVDGNAVLVGRQIRIVSLATGKDRDDGKPTDGPIDIPSGNETGKLLGRPFLAQKILYLPMEHALTMIDFSNGNEVRVTAWPKDEKGVQAKPGNLLVTSEQVIVVNDGEVASYAKWETARDSRLAAIKASPNAPEGYLSLAEVAFRTQHFDIAQENMTRAVSLAIPQGMSSDIVGQIYRTNLLQAETLAAKADETQKLARFYYDAAKKSAGTPEANAEWRMSLSRLALQEKKPEEAATLYNEVLNDAGMRASTLHDGDGTSRAASMAEKAFKTLVEEHPESYKPYEQQAQALLTRVRPGQDAAAFQNLIDSYPNSATAITAGKELAQIYASRATPSEDEIRALLWLYSRMTTPQDKARVTADLAVANARMKRWDSAMAWIARGNRAAPDLMLNIAGKQISFTDLRTKLKSQMPETSDTRRPAVSLPMDESLVKLSGGKMVGMTDAVANLDTKLLVPMETNPAARRPDLIPVLEGNRTVRLYDSKTLEQKWSSELPNPGGTILLGYTKNLILLVQSRKLTALDLKTGTLSYEVSLDLSDLQVNQRQNEAAQLQNAMMQMLQQNPATAQINWAMNQQNSDGEFQMNAPNYGTQVSIDGEQARVASYRQQLMMAGAMPGFSALRIIGNRLAVIRGNTLYGYDASNGLRKWDVALPPGCAQTIVGNDDVIAAEVEKIDISNPVQADAGFATFVVVKAEKGEKQGTIQLPEHVMWRNLGDDGVLTCVTEEGVSAFDLMGDSTKPMWHRDEFHAAAPTAIAMGLDGVAMVTRTNDLVCLSDTGETHFSPVKVSLGSATMNGLQTIKLIADGETVIVQTSQSVSAFTTNDGKQAWGAVFSEPPPPLVASQMTENHIALLGFGPIPGSDRAVKLLMFNRVDPRTGTLSNGKNEMEKPLRRAPNDPVGPNVNRWEVADGAICLDVAGSVIVYRSQLNK